MLRLTESYKARVAAALIFLAAPVAVIAAFSAPTEVHALASPQAIGGGSLGGGAIAHGAIGSGAIGGMDWGGGPSTELPGTPFVAWIADDMNGNGDANAGWSNLDTVATATPWVSSSTSAQELENGSSPQTFIVACDGHPCVRGASGDWSEVKDGARGDWSPLGADGNAYSCHIYVRTTSTSPNNIYGVWGTASASSASIGSLFYYDDRTGSGREDKILWRHYPSSGGDSLDSPDDVLDDGNWRVISIDYPGESSGGDAVLFKDGVEVGSAAVSATYANGTSSDFFHLGSVSGSFPFIGDFRAAICYAGTGSQGLASSVTSVLQARFP